MILRRRKALAFRRDGDRTTVLLGPDERDLVAHLAGQFHAVVADDDDPHLTRLYPTAYVDDADLQDDFTSLVHDDLVLTRLDAADLVKATARVDALD
ncbi:MAG: hypothetical protein CL442_09235, partial [Acidimicrobiaceae bacterium]|nr:hypothetical protein [Acidimicrobiaceae bacterium]